MGYAVCKVSADAPIRPVAWELPQNKSPESERDLEMKAKTIFLNWLLTALLALTLTGCSMPDAIDNGTQTPENKDHVAVGSRLTVHNTDSRLTLRSNMNTLASDGLYYATWSAGESESYENSDGEIVDLYDAQIYLLLGEHKTADAAQENMDSWLDAGRSNYDVTDEETILCNGQSYTMLTYRFTNEENPYSHGVSAFGIFENCSVCVELTCRESYEEDLSEMLNGFLTGFQYE